MDLQSVFRVKREYEDEVRRLELEISRLESIFMVQKSSGYQHLLVWFGKELNTARELLEDNADHGLVSIFFALKPIWQAKAKIEFIKQFLSYMSNIEAELLRVSNEHNEFIKE